jgi:hypothetical protein
VAPTGIDKCSLCGAIAPLCDSHIIPSFATAWLKNTSATGFLRSPAAINKRIQDGKKETLLCDRCEQHFSIDEKTFAEKVFYPYVDTELDQRGVPRGVVAQIKYDLWLLRFTISVHWRIVATSQNDEYFNANAPARLREACERFAQTWRDFLLGQRQDTGGTDSHILFLQSLSSVKGSLPLHMEDAIDSYLLRSVDATTVEGPLHMAVYAKVGPVALYTSIQPGHLNKMRGTRIRTKGIVTTRQDILNKHVAGFVFFSRPKEVLHMAEYSTRQESVIRETILNNPDRAWNSMSRTVAENMKTIRAKKAGDRRDTRDA